MAKYLRYVDGDGYRHGELIGDMVTPLDGEFPDFKPSNDPKVALSSVKLLSPTVPTRILSCGPGFKCMFPNEAAWPARPMYWHKPLTALNHPEGEIELPTDEYPGVNHECELGIVIGKKAKCVSIEDADDYIFGYTCYNDLTRGDFYEKGKFSSSPYFVYGKTYDGFAPMGPYVVTGLDWSNLTLKCRVNGELRQDHTTADSLWTPQKLVSWVSDMGTLNPGDVVSMGSPPGLTWLKHGDIVEVEVEGIGVLRNYVRMRGM